MSIFEYLFSTFAGFTFLLIGVSILSVFIYGPYLSIQLYGFSKKTIKKTNIDAMLILGVIVIVLGILNQIGGIIEALESLIQETDVDPQLVMAGIIESFKVPILCAFVLIITLILWYFNKKKWESLNSKV
jgi:hypothetical protein